MDASIHQSHVSIRRQRLRTIGRQYDCVKAESPLSPFLQCPIAVVALFAATMDLTSVQVPLTFITAAFAWQSARTKVAPLRTLEFIAARAASVN
jgi:hypothetical protein